MQESKMTEELNAKKELMSKAELSVWLDSYDDIFSDFDSRPRNERSLSDDFLNEAKKMVKEKPDGRIELKLIMPADLRNPEMEKVIIKNLHSHFRHFAHTLYLDKKKERIRGVILTISGFAMLILAAAISSFGNKSFWSNTIRVITEPSGWFLAWTGLDHIFFFSRKRNSEYEFNSRMAHSEIIFLSF
jgi:hypothetical protein